MLDIANLFHANKNKIFKIYADVAIKPLICQCFKINEQTNKNNMYTAVKSFLLSVIDMIHLLTWPGIKMPS